MNSQPVEVVAFKFTAVMEENTGMSLFKPGALNIENPLQNQEEAEELEDQKRRQEEVTFAYAIFIYEIATTCLRAIFKNTKTLDYFYFGRKT